jgi:GntR family transcriptional regulator
MSLIRENATSLYEQIATTLRDEIERGGYEPSGKLPSEAELSERFGVSRVTVRLAIGKLVNDSLVERKQGKGTFATGKRLQHRLDALHGFYDSLARQGVNPQMKLLRMDQAKKLPLAMHGVFAPSVKTAVYLERLHSVDGEVVALAQTWLLPEAGEISERLAQTRPTYEILESLPGWRLARADMSITAVPASGAIAIQLQVTEQNPLLVMKRTSRLSDGRVCEATLFHIRPERYEFTVSSVTHA